MTKNTNQTSATKTLGRLAVALAAAAATFGPGSDVGAAPPPWSHCAYAGHPVAADVAPLIPGHHTPPADVQAVLLGTTAVGTDCSFYDLHI